MPSLVCRTTHLGERVKALLEISKGNSTLTPDTVKAYLSDKLANYKIPEFIEIMDLIPRNPTGKILKTERRKHEQNT